MSIIAVLVCQEDLQPEALLSLKRVLNLPLAQIANATKSGTPIFEREIFDGDFDSHAEVLQALLRTIEKFGLSHKIFELPEASTYKGYERVDACQIDARILRNILSN